MCFIIKTNIIHQTHYSIFMGVVGLNKKNMRKVFDFLRWLMMATTFVIMMCFLGWQAVIEYENKEQLNAVLLVTISLLLVGLAIKTIESECEKSTK